MENNYDNVFSSPHFPPSNKILDQGSLDSIFVLGDSPSSSEYIRSDYDSIKINEFQNNFLNPDTKILFNEEPSMQTENYASTFRKMFREPSSKKQNRKGSINIDSNAHSNFLSQNEFLNQNIDQYLNQINDVFIQICSNFNYNSNHPIINSLTDLEIYFNNIFDNIKARFELIQFSLPSLLMTIIFETLKLTFSIENNNIEKNLINDEQEELKNFSATQQKISANTKNLKENELNSSPNNAMMIDWEEGSEKKFPILIPHSPSFDRISDIPKNEQYYRDNMKQTSSYFALITSALNQLPNNKGTLEDILSTIKTKNSIDVTIEFKKSISQCLNKRFKKIPGVYTLEKNLPIVDIRGLKTVTDRLIYILQNLPNQEGDIKIIKYKYKELIEDKVNEEKNVWEKTIIKTLKKRPEFNKKASKALFTFDT